jgi:hypothetical protein
MYLIERDREREREKEDQSELASSSVPSTWMDASYDSVVDDPQLLELISGFTLVTLVLFLT